MSPSFLLLLITGCLALQPLSTDLYLPSLPHMATAFGVGPDAVQHTLSLFVLGFGGAQLISGPLSDRYGRRPVLLGGLATYAAASLACAVAPSLTLLVAGRFVQALGCSTAVVVARAIIRDAYSPAEGARVIAKASSLLNAKIGAVQAQGPGVISALAESAAVCVPKSWPLGPPKSAVPS